MAIGDRDADGGRDGDGRGDEGIRQDEVEQNEMGAHAKLQSFELTSPLQSGCR